LSVLTDILDRLSNVAALKERVTDLAGQLKDIRKVVIEQQKDIAELKGQLKALIQIQAQASKRS
jgi:phage shock protein A